MPFKLILSFQRKVLPCSEKDDNFVAFAENKEHEVPFEIHMYRQLESALCYACEDMFSGMITRSRQQMPFFVLYFSLFFFCLFWLLLITFFISLFFFFFAFIFKISGPTASIFVNEKSCYLEHGTLRSNRGHYSSLDLRVFLCVQLTPLTQEGLGDPQVSCQTLRVCMSSWTPGLWR